MPASDLSHAAVVAWSLGIVSTCSVVAYRVAAAWPQYHRGVVVPAHRLSVARKLDAMDRLLLGPYAVAVGGLAAVASWGPAFSPDYRDRWLGSSRASRWCLAVYFAKTTIDSLIQLATMIWARPGDANGRLEVLAHHLVSAACFGYSLLYTRQCEFFGCLAALSEGSTLFLNGVMATKLFTGERTPRQRLFVAINGVGLWLSYILCRLLVFPFWFWRFFEDLRSHDLSAISTFQLVAYPVSTACIFLLSCFWFVLITRGLLKALKPPTTDKKRDSSDAVSSGGDDNGGSSSGRAAAAANGGTTVGISKRR